MTEKQMTSKNMLRVNLLCQYFYNLVCFSCPNDVI